MPPSLSQVARDRLADKAEEAREVWETSQNPIVYRLSEVRPGNHHRTQPPLKLLFVGLERFSATLTLTLSKIPTSPPLWRLLRQAWDALTHETDTAVVLKQLRRLDPSFSLEVERSSLPPASTSRRWSPVFFPPLDRRRAPS